MRARPLFAPLLCLLAAAAAAEPLLDSEAEEKRARAEREWARSVGALGYVYGAPLLELSIAEQRQSHGLAREIAGPRGLLAHRGGGRLPTHESAWLPLPEPDVLLSSAWLDIEREPFAVFVPPMDGRWYSVELHDAFGATGGVLSSRTHGSVGGWFLVAHTSWAGERPPGLQQDELRVATPLAWLLVRIAATPASAADLSARYQQRVKLLPLALYARSPAAAGFANPQAQSGGAPEIRAGADSRARIDAFRALNQHLRRQTPRAGEEALLALFDRAGFGPSASFDAAKLAPPLSDGLHAAAREAERMVRDLVHAPRPGKNGWSVLESAGGLLERVVAVATAPGASPASEVFTALVLHDRDGRRLDGRNDYRIRFAPDALPPAHAFWSIAAYDAESRLLVRSGASRTSVGSETTGLEPNADGSLELWISSEAPEDAERRTRWLPVQPGPLLLVARLYEPLPEVLAAGYSLPPVVPADD